MYRSCNLNAVVGVVSFVSIYLRSLLYFITHVHMRCYLTMFSVYCLYVYSVPKFSSLSKDVINNFADVMEEVQ